MPMQDQTPPTPEAVRAVEAVQTVVDTIRFVCLSPRAWISQRFSEMERDSLRHITDRLSRATPADILRACVLCYGGFDCTPGCPLEGPRERALAAAGLTGDPR